MTQLNSLTSLPQALSDAGYENPGYQALLEAAQAGWIPAEESRIGLWVYDPAHLVLIAGILQLEAIAELVAH